jgi:CubicO group peptidase (beta-lactamase class C family)
MNVKLQIVSLLRIALLAIVCLFSATAYADDLRRTKAEKVGMSSVRLERLEDLNQRYVDEGKLAGVMTMVARHGKIVHVSAAGTYGVDNDKPLAEDTLFRIYSMSKPITAVALMMLYEEGAFQLSDPVSKFLPQFENMQVWKQDHYEDTQGPITMHHLLTHTAGLTYGYPGASPVDDRYQEADLLGAKDLDEFIDKLAEIPLLFEPGERWHYGVASDVLGAVAEEISGQNYAEFLKKRIFDPLGMDDTFFYVPADKLERFPTNHLWNAEESKLVAVADDAPLNSSYFGGIFYAGGMGLVSTIGDYMKFLEMLRNGGALGKVRILSPKTIEYMTRNHLAATTEVGVSGEAPTIDLQAAWRGIGFGLGFGIVTDPAKTGVISSPDSYFWGGYAGTVFWIDPEEELVGIGMLQLINSPWPFRKEMMVATYQAIEKLNRAK